MYYFICITYSLKYFLICTLHFKSQFLLLTNVFVYEYYIVTIGHLLECHISPTCLRCVYHVYSEIRGVYFMRDHVINVMPNPTTLRSAMIETSCYSMSLINNICQLLLRWIMKILTAKFAKKGFRDMHTVCSVGFVMAFTTWNVLRCVLLSNRSLGTRLYHGIVVVVTKQFSPLIRLKMTTNL